MTACVAQGPAGLDGSSMLAMNVLAHRAPGGHVRAYVLHPAICIAVTRILASDSEAHARYSKNPTDGAS